MPFIGQNPSVGAYNVLDNITIGSNTNGPFNMLLNGAAFSPESANHLLVSLNGVIQKPGSSFTVSGSQITFVTSSGTLTTSDSIDFIMALGNVLDVGVPTDGSISSNKIATGAVTDAKITGMTSSKLTGALPAVDGSSLTGRGMKFITKSSLSSNVSQLDLTLPAANHDYYKIIGHLDNTNDNVYLIIRFFDHLLNLTNGTDYHSARNKTNSSGTVAATGSQASTLIGATPPMGNTGTEENGMSFELLIGPTNTSNFPVQLVGQAFLHEEGSMPELIGFGGGFIEKAKTFGGVRFEFSGGEIGQTSELYVYGMSKS